MLERTYKFLLGDDIFISYSRADGTTYATGLANELVEKKFSCRLDQWGTEAGREVPESLKRALKRSAILVLVGTEGAAQSRHVAQEIIEFKKSGRIIIPIAFDGTLVRKGLACRNGRLEKAEESIATKAEPSGNALATGSREALWADQIEGLAIFCESQGAFDSGTPSAEVMNRIEKTFTFSRKDERLRKTSIGVSILLFVLIAASVVAASVAAVQSADAAEKTRLAQEATAEAGRQQKIAADEKTKADNARTLAEGEKIKAQEAKEQARIQTELAETAKKKADEQTKIAEKAEERATIARDEAARQESIAISRELSAQAVNIMDERLDTALAYSLEAFDATRFPTFEAKQSLLSGLTFSPHLQNFVSPRNYAAGGTKFDSSADGQLIVSIEDLKKILLWRNASPPLQPRPLYEENDVDIWAVAISQDGKTVAAGLDDKTVRLWDTATGKRWESNLNYPSVVRALAFNLKGDKLGVGLGDGSVYVSEVNSSASAGRLLGVHPPRPERGMNNFVEFLAFSPDDKSLASYSDPESLIIWDLTRQSDDQKLSVLKFDRVRTMCFSPNSRLLAFSSGRTIMLWDRNARALVRPFNEDDPAVPFALGVGEAGRTSDSAEDEVVSLSFDPEGQYLTAVTQWRRLYQWYLEGLDDDDQGGTRAMELASTRPPSDVLLKGPDDFSKAAFVDNGRMFITQSSEGRFTSWDVYSRPALSSILEGASTQDVVFNPVNGALISVGDYGMAVWDGAQRRIVKENPANPENGSSNRGSEKWKSLAVSADGRSIAAGSWNNKYTLIDAQSYQTRYSFTLPENLEADFVTFDPNLRLVLAADSDGKYYIWELREREQPERLTMIEGRPPFAFGKGTLVSSTLENLYLWDIRNPKKPRRLDEQALNHRPTSFAFSNDGKRLASAGQGGSVLLWSVGEKLQQIKLRGNIAVKYQPVETGSSVAFSPDNQMVVAGGHGSEAIGIWDIAAGRLIGHIPTSMGDPDRLSFSPDGKKLAAQVLAGIMVSDLSPESWKERARHLIGSTVNSRR